DGDSMETIERAARSAVVRFAIVVVLGVGLRAVAQEPAQFTRVLVPVTVSLVPGAYGTVWSTELWYRNNPDHPVGMFPLAVSDFVPAVRRPAFLPIGSR